MTAPGESLLAELQALLARVYDIESRHPLHRFLITDRHVADALDQTGSPSGINEKLLLAEDAEAGAMELSLFVAQEVLDRLQAADPLRDLNDGNLPDFLTALEGVSHFVYLTWNAGHGKQVTLLELEMQAEVDKYVVVLLLLSRQLGGAVPARLHGWLFDRPRFDGSLTGELLDRYRTANRYAARYCRRLEGKYLSRWRPRGLMGELRRFYRLPQSAKIRHIDTAPA